jgi:hypothetical protein
MAFSFTTVVRGLTEENLCAMLDDAKLGVRTGIDRISLEDGRVQYDIHYSKASENGRHLSYMCDPEASSVGERYELWARNAKGIMDVLDLYNGMCHKNEK